MHEMDSLRWLGPCLIALRGAQNWGMRARVCRERCVSCPSLDVEKALAGVAAAVEFARSATGEKVGVVGFCFGGTIAWLTATRGRVDAAVGSCGGRIAG